MIDEKLMAKIRKLDIDDRVLLAHAIWDEVAAEVEAAPLTKAQMTELQRRLDKYGDSTEGIPWEEVQRELIEAERDESHPSKSSTRSKRRPQGNTRVVQKAGKRAQRQVSK